MALSHEHIGPKISSKIKIYILSRAKLLCSVCHEIPCMCIALVETAYAWLIWNYFAYQIINICYSCIVMMSDIVSIPFRHLDNPISTWIFWKMLPIGLKSFQKRHKMFKYFIVGKYIFFWIWGQNILKRFKYCAKWKFNV